MFTMSYMVLGAVAVALVVTLMLAAWLTPRTWWRQLNLRALAVVGLGTWAIASLLLSMAPATEPAPLAALTNAGRSFRVHDDLNLRAAKGTAALRIAVVPAGAVVTTTGVHDGDWWQVSARVAGKDVTGWSSSLWLRRAGE
jgi:hypothetical protein